jgi:MoaA/NifB/PqqE/SkfB family radical SAM enzyme
MRNIYKWPLWHWHIEISSKCTLECPRCPRALVPNTLVQTELDLNFFKNTFTPELLKHEVQKFTFCGDDGDPIYAKDFLNIIEYIKQNNKNIQIEIVTNGSYKTSIWWNKLAKTLNNNDLIHFSIDGFDQESNEQYRINCNWKSMMVGLEIMCNNSEAFVQWACIAFKFNEHKLDHMKQLAIDIGCDLWQLTLSTQFGSKYDHYNVNGYDKFEPNNKELIADDHRYDRTIHNLTNRQYKRNYIKHNSNLYTGVKSIYNDSPHIPICLIGNKGMYINSKGKFFPCCWVAQRFEHQEPYWVSPEFDLNNNTLEEVLNSDKWTELFDSLITDKTFFECEIKCPSKVVDHNYATTW